MTNVKLLEQLDQVDRKLNEPARPPVEMVKRNLIKLHDKGVVCKRVCVEALDLLSKITIATKDADLKRLYILVPDLRPAGPVE